MGRPAHYSRDLTARCLSLLSHLLPVVEKGLPDDDKFGGALTTTFVLAMATPVIALPIERIYKPSAGINGLGDDRFLNDNLSDDIGKLFNGKTKFSDAPFFKGDWRFVRNVAPFNIASDWPADLLKSLGSAPSAKVANDVPISGMMIHLRNSLAHGGVTYLDDEGGQSNGKASMLGFVSAKMKDHKIIGLHASRISENDFIAFIVSWSEWIAQSGLAKALNEHRDLAA